MKKIALASLLPMSAFAQNPVVPVLNSLVADRSGEHGQAVEMITLSDHFGTEEIRDNAVRLTASWKTLDDMDRSTNFDFLLFRDRTPITVTNFLGYVERGDYANMIVHRVVKNFVIQGGGFNFVQVEGGPQSGSVPTQAPIMNEFGVSNTLGTISMAKLGGDPDSATSQWFVSTGANSDNLDFQNGGFTVFGRISRSSFQNASDLNDLDDFKLFPLGGALASTPLVTGTTQATFTADRFFRFSSVAEIPLPADQAGTDTNLTYEATSSAPGIAASVDGGVLTLDYSGQAFGGSWTVTVTATDSVGNEVLDTFTVNKSVAYDGWRASVFNAEDAANDTVSGPAADPNGDGVSNLAAFAQGFLPDEDLSDRIRIPSFVTVAAGNRIELPIQKSLEGVAFTLQSCNDLFSWETIPATETILSREGNDLLRLQTSENPTDNPIAYYRVLFSLSE